MLTVGDKVRALRMLVQDATGDSPAFHLCNKNDLLFVREVRDPSQVVFPILVSHTITSKSTFGVIESEIEKTEL